MRIKKITFELRNDFAADMECEFCKNVQHLSSGYNDAHYHSMVIPSMRCEACGRSTVDPVEVKA